MGSNSIIMIAIDTNIMVRYAIKESPAEINFFTKLNKLTYH